MVSDNLLLPGETDNHVREDVNLHRKIGKADYYIVTENLLSTAFHKRISIVAFIYCWMENMLIENFSSKSKLR